MLRKDQDLKVVDHTIAPTECVLVYRISDASSLPITTAEHCCFSGRERAAKETEEIHMTTK